MEYGIRTRGLGAGGGGGGGGPASWLETATAYGHPLAPFQFPSGAALLLNSLHSLQQSGANAMELVWKPDKHKPPDDDEEDEEPEEEEDEEEERRDNSPVDEAAAEGLVVKAEDEEDDDEERPDGVENDGSVESWKETPMPILSGWMLNAYASMLGRLTAATATSVFEPTESSNLTSDSESESNRSSDMQSRESSPSRPTYQICDGTTNSTSKSRSRKKCQRRTSDAKTKNSKKEDPGTADSSPSNSQGNKRSSALQRVRYRYEREEYRCSLCSYACTIEKAFQRHLRAHARGTANESRVSCAVCGADRSSEVDLSKHMRRHRDNRYFCCDICIFRTVQLKKLIQHRRMHTGEKPHLCPHCAYRSARRDNLRSHVRRVHKKENLYCDTFSPRGMFIAPKLQPAASLDEEEELVPSASPSPTPPPPPPPPIENAEPQQRWPRDEETAEEESSEMA